MRLEAERVLEDQEPYLSNLTSWSSWERWRDAVVARYRAQGAQCPLATLMRQVGATPRADEAVAALLDRWESRLVAGIRAMQESGDFRDSLVPERTAAAIVAAVQGGVQLLRTTGTTSHLEAVLDLLLDHLRARPGVLPA
ncbi:hypothetical protein IF650_14665 [Cellulosimicrobium terreum]|nr:hypothetical protein [Cellulosimicrobium terreum]